MQYLILVSLINSATPDNAFSYQLNNKPAFIISITKINFTFKNNTTTPAYTQYNRTS